MNTFNVAQSKDVPIAASSLDGEKEFDKVEWRVLFTHILGLVLASLSG